MRVKKSIPLLIIVIFCLSLISQNASDKKISEPKKIVKLQNKLSAAGDNPIIIDGNEELSNFSSSGDGSDGDPILSKTIILMHL